ALGVEILCVVGDAGEQGCSRLHFILMRKALVGQCGLELRAVSACPRERILQGKRQRRLGGALRPASDCRGDENKRKAGSAYQDSPPEMRPHSIVTIRKPHLFPESGSLINDKVLARHANSMQSAINAYDGAVFVRWQLALRCTAFVLSTALLLPAL